MPDGLAEAEAQPRSPPGAEEAERERFRRELVAGLSARPRRLSSVWFYDAEGSSLFQRIAELPEYYLTRCEREILEAHGGEITAGLSGRACTAVDLGAGDGHKTASLLSRLRESAPRLRYAPVDVSPAALAEAGERARAAGRDLEVLPVPADYLDGLRWLRRRSADPFLVLFLGSNVGNMEHGEATSFFRALRAELRPGDRALVGFDLVKEEDLLLAAYDDAAGVTAAFNLNLLARANRELGADFDLGAWRHLATFDPGRRALDSWLVSQRRQTVRLGPDSFTFRPGETVHTEVACKYLPEDLTRFAAEAGFREEGRWLDSRGWFADVLWQA